MADNHEDNILLVRDSFGNTYPRENQYTELMKSTLSLISEEAQRYQADIDTSVYEGDNLVNPEVELHVNPAAVKYLLEPGEQAEIRREVGGNILSEGERYPATVRFVEDLYDSEIDSLLSYNFHDPKLEAMGDGSVTLDMEENPILRKTAI